MTFYKKIKTISVAVLLTAMLFSCGNTDKEIHDFLQEKNLPILEAKDIHLIHTDSGRVDLVMQSPLLLDFRNRKAHPYTEFPKGIQFISIKKNDSTSIKGNYAITYNNTNISDIKGNVIIYNYSKKYKLVTSQIFWDQTMKVFFTEERFKLYTPTDTIPGRGFESDENLENYITKNIRNGSVEVSEFKD
ncbi:MAG: LPS export ABC transporter periplasmic protein LptC [Flavobacteriaceae bacterium]|nr:LPS export ABC transporter periplasmic protein LptC [Flavobacteriaceae bacterium]